MNEVNRFHQKPKRKECPRYQTRQYTHPEYGFFEVTVDECNAEDVEAEFKANVENTISEIEQMRKAEEEDQIILETEDGGEIIV